MLDEQDKTQTIEDLIFSDESDEKAPLTETEEIMAEDEEEAKTIVGGELDEEPVEEDADNVTDITPAEEPIDELNETIGFYQTSYQKLTEKLKATDPAMYNQIQTQLKAERKGIEPVREVDDDEDDFEARISRKIENGFKQLETKQTAQLTAERYVTEYKLANSVLEEFVAQHKVSEEDLNAAFKEAADLGFDLNTANQNYTLGLPNKAVKFIMKELEHRGIQRYLQNKTAKTEADVTQRVDAIKNVSQPASGALPEQKTQTRTEKLLAKMNDVSVSNTNNEVFG